MRRMAVALVGLLAVAAQAQQPVTSNQRRLYTECVGSMERGAREAFMQSAGSDQPGLHETLQLTDICIQQVRKHPLSDALMREFESLVDTYRGAISVPSAAAAGVEASKGTHFLMLLN